jgi:hypothetical protein
LTFLREHTVDEEWVLRIDVEQDLRQDLYTCSFQFGLGDDLVTRVFWLACEKFRNKGGGEMKEKSVGRLTR